MLRQASSIFKHLEILHRKLTRSLGVPRESKSKVINWRDSFSTYDLVIGETQQKLVGMFYWLVVVFFCFVT